MRPLTIMTGDVRKMLQRLPDKCVQTCVTSPPYWGLRDYKRQGQRGMEPTPELYVQALVADFREVWRVLRDNGTLWLNLGDCYTESGRGGNPTSSAHQLQRTNRGAETIKSKRIARGAGRWGGGNACAPGRKRKDLIGVPWLVAFALQAAGWYLRCDIIWSKPNPMPESVKDRPTRAHEYLFLLTKKERYFYNADAIKEKPSPELVKQIEEGYRGKAIKDYLGSSVQDASQTKSRIIQKFRERIDKQRGHGRRHAGFNRKWDALSPAEQAMLGANKRSVWTVAPANFKGAHFATFPPKLITPCILAGSRPGDLVLDPFGGSGTTAEVALMHGRKAVLIDLNPDYVEMAKRRCGMGQMGRI